MMPLAHLIFAFILGSFLNSFGFGLNLVLFSLLAVVIDFDIFHSKDHRSKSVTHFPLFWLALTPIFSLFLSPIYLLAILSHFILDSIDYGVNWLWPFKNKLYGLFLNGFKETTDVPLMKYLTSYAKNKRMIAIEALILLVGFSLL